MIKVLIITLLTKCVFAEYQFTIGGLFYEGPEDMEEALNASAQLFNFTPEIKKVSKKGEILEAGNKACELIEKGIIGIIDGTSGRTSAHVQAICDLLDVPHILIDHNDLVQDNWLHLNLHPGPVAFNRVLKELVTMKEWTNFTILYEKGYSLLRVSSLLEMASKTLTVSVRELSGRDYRDILINAKENSYTNFIVDCPSNKLEQFLLQAQQVGLMADEHSYIFLSADLFAMDLSSYRYGGVNMTGFRLVNLADSKDLNAFHESMSINATEGDTQPLKTKPYLVHDAVKAFFEARLKVVDMTRPERNSVNCRNFQSWEYGSSLLNLMKTNEIEGITRSLRFDGAGQRSDVIIEVLELTSAGHQVKLTLTLDVDHLLTSAEFHINSARRLETRAKDILYKNTSLQLQRTLFQSIIANEQIIIGKWDFRTLNMTRPNLPSMNTEEESIMKNKTFKVLVSENAQPFTYLKESAEALTGNDRYEGFAVDLFENLSEMLGFTFILENNLVYGSYNTTTHTTDGMVGEIFHERADFAICDFTITSNRQRAIDFSIPFMTTGIGILYQEPRKQPPEMFSFMAVFAPEVWYYMLLIQLALGVVMIVVGRLSNKEWQNPVPCIENPEELSNQFSFANSVWLIIGSVMQQGSEIAPIALAPRMITSIWWFFTMIMVASYVGTLVAFLTVEKNVLPFRTVEELYNQKSIIYGAKKTGSTINFFGDQPEGSMYKDMYNKMTKNNWNVEENKDGVTKARQQPYACFMESSAIEYYKERNCDLIQIGDLLDSKSYGIGMKKNSPYKKLIDDALLKLKEQGKIQNMKDLWWKEKRGGGKCGQEEEDKDKALSMKHMTGVFVVLGAGCLVGIIISVLDMHWGVYKRSVKYGTTFKYELIKELKFALRFSGDVKPVKRPPKVDDSAEALAVESKDEVGSLQSFSVKSTSTHRTCHSHGSHRSSRHSSLSVAFARRRKYS